MVCEDVHEDSKKMGYMSGTFIICSLGGDSVFHGFIAPGPEMATVSPYVTSGWCDISYPKIAT